MGKKSITTEFLKDRFDSNGVENLEVGTWYSGFSKAYNYAIQNKIPFIGVWSNGDACYYCKKLEKNFMTNLFRDWMKNCECIFWFGCSLDKSEDDKAYGKGFYWGWDNKTVKTYPFMRFYWTDGNKIINKSAPGNVWNKSKDEEIGAQNVIDQLNELLDSVHSNDPMSVPCEKLKIRINPEMSQEEVEEFKQAIKDNDGYCPCVPEHTNDSKCMCKWFREQQTEGNCHCGLYNKYY